VAGRFELRLLTERYQAFKYNTRAHFFQRDQGTRDFNECKFRGEKRTRSVKTGKKDTWFFDWNEATSFRNKGRSHSIISELYYAAQRARIGINYDKKNNLIAIWANEDKSTTKQCKKRETAQAVGKIFEERQREGGNGLPNSVLSSARV
jgi:hypothetical protein